MFWVLLVAAIPAAAEDPGESIKRFLDVYAAVEAEAADPVSAERAFFEGALPGMMRRLDPHSAFFDPAQFEQLQQLEQSTSKGFGSVVSVLPGRVIVLQTLPGTPSSRSGLSPGDEILAINGIRLDSLDMEQLVGLLSQSRQREAKLDVRRPGNARLLQFALIPEQMQSPSVDRAFLLRAGVGYVRVASFDSATGKELRAAIEKLGGTALRGLVLDLRNNPGGVLPAALESASLFLKPGQRILSVRGRRVEAKDIDVPAEAVPYAFPVAVLVNEKSASASEIVAGALQDNDRATIVGAPTFGKGLVQSVYPLSHGTGLALTTSYYHAPSGRSIQKPLSGSTLDASTSAARDEAAREFRTASGRVVKGGGGIHPDILVDPERATRLGSVLEASGSFPSFATEYTRHHPAPGPSFAVSAAVLDEFQVFLSERNIRPSVAEWSADREWIRSRLHQEILNQTAGVEKGDEIEMRRDPQVRAAVEALQAP